MLWKTLLWVEYNLLSLQRTQNSGRGGDFPNMTETAEVYLVPSPLVRSYASLLRCFALGTCNSQDTPCHQKFFKGQLKKCLCRFSSLTRVTGGHRDHMLCHLRHSRVLKDWSCLWVRSHFVSIKRVGQEEEVLRSPNSSAPLPGFLFKDLFVFKFMYMWLYLCVFIQCVQRCSWRMNRCLKRMTDSLELSLQPLYSVLNLTLF